MTSPPEAFNDLRFCVIKGDVELAGRRLFNGFEPTVFAKYPLLALIAEEMVRAGAAGSIMCGSGSSMFGLARDGAQAEAIRSHLARTLGPSVWCRTVTTLPDGVMVAHGPLEARV